MRKDASNNLTMPHSQSSAQLQSQDMGLGNVASSQVKGSSNAPMPMLPTRSPDRLPETVLHLESSDSQTSVDKSSHSEFANPPPQSTKSSSRMEVILSDIASYVKLQDEVTMLRVNNQQKRTALTRLRDLVAQKDLKLGDTLRQSELTEVVLKHPAYVLLLSASVAARNELGPAEEEFAELDRRLVNKEASLTLKGSEIRRRYQTLSTTELGKLVLPTKTIPNDDDRASSKFSFDTESTAEPLKPQAILYEPSRALSTPGHTPVNLFPGEFDLTRSRQPDDTGLESQYATHASSHRMDYRHPDETQVEQFAPDLRDPGRLATPEKPELYVIEQDFAELEGTHTNNEEGVEPFLMDQLPSSLASLNACYGDLFKMPMRHINRWIMHQWRKSPRDMLEYSAMKPDDKRWVLLSWADGGSAERSNPVVPFSPPEARSRPKEVDRAKVPPTVWW